MKYSPAVSRFALWSPDALSVELLLYRLGQGGAPAMRYNLETAGNGWWQLNVYRDLNGWFYTYRVLMASGWLPETPGPDATAVGVNGERAAIIDLSATNPDGWECDQRPPMAPRPIIYELHHRDYSISHSSGNHHKGHYLALTERTTHSPEGLSTGIDHLVELGITHVQLLPSFDFSSIDEGQPRVPHYNWGYDPQNYNVPEGSYATDAEHPMTRIREFKQMVQALHRVGIRVVLDVVYNHVASVEHSAFQRTAPRQYFRYAADGSLANGSGCGNETASERAAMRQFMVESVAYWASEYHIDGFRFDLMALHDKATMKAIAERLATIDPTIFIYGEGWAAAPPMLPKSQSMTKQNVHCVKGIAAFGDEMRDALRGPIFDDAVGGFLMGNTQCIDLLKLGIVGAIAHPQLEHIKHRAWATQPTQMLAYVSCHDDLCLYDRLCATHPNISDEEAQRLSLLAHTAVLTSQGVPFLFAGEEMLRTKRGVRNSYRSPDMVNAIDWRNKSQRFGMYTYLRKLIAVRKQCGLFQLGTATAVRRQLRFLDVGAHCAVAYVIRARSKQRWRGVLVILNAEHQTISVEVPRADYQVIAKAGVVNPDGLFSLSASRVEVPAQSAFIAAFIHEISGD